MNKLINIKLFLTLIIFIISNVSLADDLDFLRLSHEAKKENNIAKYMNFSDGENASFWKIYKEYESEINIVHQGYFDLIRDYKDAYVANTITDNLAEKLTARYLDLESKKVSIKKVYASKFKKALSSKKIARFFQIEHRSEILINYEIAKQIPLIN